MERMFDTIISLVGGQPSPVLIPYYTYGFKKVVMIRTRTTQDETEQIKNILRKRFKDISIEDDIEVHPYDFNEIKDVLTTNLSKYKGEKILCNITGATKNMSFQLKEWADKNNVHSCYVSSEEGVIYLFKNNEIKKEEISAKITVDEYLKAHGYRVEVREKGKRGEGGYWLEDEVFKKILKEKLKGKIDDCKKSFHIIRGNTVNEIDVAVTKNFRFGIISCKAISGPTDGKQSEEKHKNRRVRLFIDELIARGSSLGRYTRMFFVTTYKLSDQSPIVKKALLNGVIVYSSKDLVNVGKLIAQKMRENIPAT